MEFLTLAGTFFLVLVPYFVYGIFTEIANRKQKKSVSIRKYVHICLFFSCFFLLLFSWYKNREIMDVVSYLSESVNIKFIMASYFISFITLFIHIIFKKNVWMFDTDFKRIPGYLIISLLVFFFLMNISFVLISTYGIVPVEQIVFHLSLERAGANYSIIRKAIVIILFQTMVFQVSSLYVLSAKISIKTGKAGICIPFKKFRKLSAGVAIVLPVIGLVYLMNTTGLSKYIRTSNKDLSNFYEENYIFPDRVNIGFPEQKRNLIVIIVEGLETGYLTIENGGAFAEDLMPEVALLAKNNINFSQHGGIGGPSQLYGAEWTIAGITGYYSAVPLALRFLNLTGWNNYGSIGDDFLPGAYSIGDILHNAGYKSYFFLGSEIEFGGRDKYFKTHKNTVIYDYNYFRDNNYIPDDYRVWWGIEDRRLYEFAKTKISEISREEPFFITLLTVDTHPIDGYLDNEAESHFDSQFKNVIRDMSKQLFSFVDWLIQQDFYENTTIVILGDHLYQDSSFFPDKFKIRKLNSRYEKGYFTGDTAKSYNRYPINIFINSLLSHSDVKNRSFSHFDMLPAMIESIGGSFEAKGLALGRSMINGATLLEQYGEAEMNGQLQLKSNLYESFWRKQ